MTTGAISRIEELESRYESAPGPTWYPRDEHGNNVAHGQFRCDSEGWIYVDDVDGYSELTEDEALVLRQHSEAAG